MRRPLPDKALHLLRLLASLSAAAGIFADRISEPAVHGEMDLLEKHFLGEQGCDPKLIAKKREKMAADILDFFRGSAGMFYALWSHRHPGHSPMGWICGDAHWENVGSYKGKNHVAYFDFTDFDNACLAPLRYDLGRAATSMYLLNQGGLAPIFLAAYRQDLAAGKPYHIEAEVASGTIARLLDRVKNRSQAAFIKENAKHGRLRLDGDETFPLSRREKTEVTKVFRRWAATMTNPAFFELLDICGSCSGVGAMGHRRYRALVKGRNSPHLIDMKEATPSAAVAFSSADQGIWVNEAERTAEVQRIIQYVPIARLGWSRTKGESFVFSEFQPSEDRVDSMTLSKKEYRNFASQWGKLLAWSHLRGGGWRGAATTSELIAFADHFNKARQRRFLSEASGTARNLQALFTKFQEIVGAEGT